MMIIVYSFHLLTTKKIEVTCHSRDQIFGHGHDQCCDFVHVEYEGHIGGQRSNMMESSKIYINFDFSKIFLNLFFFRKPHGQYSLFFIHIDFRITTIILLRRLSTSIKRYLFLFSGLVYKSDVQIVKLISKVQR